MKLKLIAILLLFTGVVQGQKNLKWDDTINSNWSEPFKQVEIPSSADGELQKAFIHFPENEIPQPLIVSLHTWSGDYTQRDPLSIQIAENGWNYIHPNFRGSNNSPKACGSKFVVSDIDDAISFAIENGNVDPSNIHIIGVSGGGFATMLAYMKSKHNVRSFSSWVGISDLVNWYNESLGRKNNYAKHIALVTTGDTLTIDVAEAISRSPIFMETPINKRKNSKLFLYCGVHDGYTGSVPISQTVDFYNKVINDFQPENVESLVSNKIRETLLRQQNLPGMIYNEKVGDRKIVYRNSFQDKIYLTVFEGAHEMIEQAGLNPIPSKNILVIGDSNGAAEHGWVNQLKKLRPYDLIVNTSVSGNTIGFNNGNTKRLNTLEMIDDYINQAFNNAGSPNYIVVLLGTNDCKAIFDDQLKEVPGNLEKLISMIKNHKKIKVPPKILVVTPPPYGADEILLDKYKGGSGRVNYLVKEFKKVAQKIDVAFIDVHTPLEPVFGVLSDDGVHLSAEGQIIIAKLIHQKMKQ